MGLNEIGNCLFTNGCESRLIVLPHTGSNLIHIGGCVLFGHKVCPAKKYIDEVINDRRPIGWLSEKILKNQAFYLTVSQSPPQCVVRSVLNIVRWPNVLGGTIPPKCLPKFEQA